MKKDNSVYIRHIMDSISRIERYTKGMGKRDFLGDELVQAGVVRELEIIGEAAKQLSQNFKTKHDNIPWKMMAGMRDKLIHDYFGVDMDAVWNTLVIDIPRMKGKIQKLLE